MSEDNNYEAFESSNSVLAKITHNKIVTNFLNYWNVGTTWFAGVSYLRSASLQQYLHIIILTVIIIVIRKLSPLFNTVGCLLSFTWVCDQIHVLLWLQSCSPSSLIRVWKLVRKTAPYDR